MIKVNWREERKHGRVRGRKTILPVPSSLWSSGKWRVGERMEPIYDPVVSGERMEPAYDPVVSGGEDGANLWSSGEWWVGEKMEDRKQKREGDCDPVVSDVQGRGWKTGSRKERETVIQWWVLCRGEDGRQEAGKRGRLWSSCEWCAGEKMEDRKQKREGDCDPVVSVVQGRGWKTGSRKERETMIQW